MDSRLTLFKLLEKRASSQPLSKTAKPWLNEGDFTKLCKRVRKSKSSCKKG